MVLKSVAKHPVSDSYAENQHWLLTSVALVTGVQWTRSSRVLDDRFIAGTASDPVSESIGASITTNAGRTVHRGIELGQGQLQSCSRRPTTLPSCWWDSCA